MIGGGMWTFSRRPLFSDGFREQRTESGDCLFNRSVGLDMIDGLFHKPSPKNDGSGVPSKKYLEAISALFYIPVNILRI
jgi:hypothetical protein